MTVSTQPQPRASLDDRAPLIDLLARAASTVAIFGAGHAGELAFRALSRDARIVAFVDNGEAKWGSRVCGVRVVSPAELQVAWPDTVVVASQAAPAIVAQLDRLGLPRHRIHVYAPAADDVGQAQFQTAVEDLRAEITSLLGFAPDAGPALRLVIFGAGAGGREAWTRCRSRHRIVGFADNDPAKIGTSLFDLPVLAPATLPATTFDRVVVGSMYFDPIAEQLVRLGVARDRICTVDDVLRAGGVQ
jgi:FlaA1/EpsC-like NDP-sugar epimerase